MNWLRRRVYLWAASGWEKSARSWAAEEQRLAAHGSEYTVYPRHRARLAALRAEGCRRAAGRLA